MVALGIAAVLSATSRAADPNENPRSPGPTTGAQWFENHRGETQIPDALVQKYGEFVKSARQPQSDFLNIMLPHSISISYQERPAATREYGGDLNLPFLQNGFDAQVQSVRKDGADCYLLRTTSSALWFVETKSQGWRLYRYLDKPIK